jgi:NADH-quinone oxidoreductase subunit F
MSFEPVLTANVGFPEARMVRGYRDRGGYRALEAALRLQPEELVDLVKKSGLRGRGGAGFPCGLKWSFVPKGPGRKYIVCNADESEPGTFKDRLLMEHDPHQLIEGCVLAGWAVGAETTYIYIRGEYTHAARVLESAIADAYAAGVLGSSVLGSAFRHDVYVHRGAGAYICGEETGLLESLEGKRGQPRVKPPFPAVVGAFQSPTVINNVETLCCVVHIVNRGVDWFKSIGTDERNTGPKLYAISGHVERPGTYELPIGVTFRDLLETAGGMYKGRRLKAWIPGGASAPMLTADEVDLKMDFDTLAKAGSMLGSAAVIVLDETACVVRSTLRLASFFAHESCGQCTPCREGTEWMRLLLERIESGRGTEGDLDLLARVVPNVGGISLCALGDAAQGPVKSLIQKFGDEIRDNIRNRRYPLPRTPFFDLGAVA